VEKCEEGTNLWEKVPGSPTGDSQVVKGLEPGKKYLFRVKAQNKLGLGEPCVIGKAVLAKNPYDAPGEPKDAEIAKYDKSSVTLKWKAPNDDGGNPIKGYIIEKMQKTGRGDGNWTPVNSSPVSGTSFTVPNLIEGAEMEFRVVAVNDAGPGKPSKTTGPHPGPDFNCWSPEPTPGRQRDAQLCHAVLGQTHGRRRIKDPGLHRGDEAQGRGLDRGLALPGQGHRVHSAKVKGR